MAVSAVPASAIIAGAETLETANVEVDYLASGKTVEILGEKYETDTTSLWLSTSEKKLTKTDRKNIGRLKKLEDLTIKGYGAVLKDLSFLKSCKKLKTLKLMSCTVEDYAALGELSSLTELKLISMTLTKNNIKQIGKLKKLKGLEISYCSAESYSALKNLTGLESLEFDASEESSGKDLSFIKKMKNLKELVLYIGYQSKLPSLGNLTKLEKLWVGCDGYLLNGSISSISGLDKLKNLKVLDLCDLMAFSDLSALADLKNLEEIDLHYIDENDVKTLARLPSLKELGYCRVKNAESLEETEAKIKKIQESLPNCDVHDHNCY